MIRFFSLSVSVSLLNWLLTLFNLFSKIFASSTQMCDNDSDENFRSFVVFSKMYCVECWCFLCVSHSVFQEFYMFLWATGIEKDFVFFPISLLLKCVRERKLEKEKLRNIASRTMQCTEKHLFIPFANPQQ